MELNTIGNNIALIKENIAKAAGRRGVSPESVSLLAATKQNDASRVRQAISAGITMVGENRVQEMCDKLSQGAYAGCELHFIGHLQRNKVKNVVGPCSLIHSVGSLPLAEEISKCAEVNGVTQKILLEVNIGLEASKTGFFPEEVFSAVEYVCGLKNTRLSGLMAIPPAGDPDGSRKYFSQMYKLFVDIIGKKYDNVYMDTLSIGMSEDYAIAVEEGATLVRIGSLIFGSRT